MKKKIVPQKSFFYLSPAEKKFVAEKYNSANIFTTVTIIVSFTVKTKFLCVWKKLFQIQTEKQICIENKTTPSPGLNWFTPNCVSGGVDPTMFEM